MNERYILESVLKVFIRSSYCIQINIMNCCKMNFFDKIKDVTYDIGPEQFLHRGSNEINRLILLSPALRLHRV